ncbi:hypothetical protein BRD00_12400 [Halobacteriales archaeon QS_8_69_26]|nr:MAG: hypothetical protein BRD00_12400 [Halobacteriales archaeon QS_8_69_26]
MPSRRAVLGTVAAVGLTGCSSLVDSTGPVDAAATGKRLDGTVEGEWRTVARCEPVAGHGFEYEEAPVAVPLAVHPGPAARDGPDPSPDLPDDGPLVADRPLLEDLREAYDAVRFGLSLTAIDRDRVHDRDPGTETTYWVASGSFDRVLVGDRVTIRPSEDDPHGIESIADVTSIRTDRG